MTKQDRYTTWVVPLLLIVLGGIALCYDAFLNGYPIVFSDTGTYLRSGFKNIIPEDRPIFYGWFARHFSLKRTFWLPIFFQGVFISAGIYNLLQHTAKRNVPVLFVSTIAMLLLLTNASYYVSELLPDFTTPLVFLCLVNMFVIPAHRRGQHALNWIILVYSLCCHSSNLLILGLTAGVVVLVYVVKWRRPDKRLIMFSLCIPASLLVTLSVSYLIDGNAKLSKGSNVFLMGKLWANGMIQDQLPDACEEDSYQICDHLDAKTSDFLWDYANSPLYKTGSWVANNEEYGRILRWYFGQWENTKAFLSLSARDTWLQLHRISTPDVMYIGPNSAPDIAIAKYINSEHDNFRASLQFDNPRYKEGFKQWDVIVIWFSLAVLMLLIPLSIRNGWQVHWMILAFFSYYFFNAVVCGSLSFPGDRYQARIAWLAPLMLFICLTRVIPAYNYWRYSKANLEQND